MQQDPNLEHIGLALADISRKRMLCALMDGRAHTSKELALCAGVTASTTSGHLAMLRHAGLILSEKSGRAIYHRLAGADVAGLLEGLSALVPPSFAASLRAARRRDPDSLGARCCYDHIAGALGVGLCDALQASGAIVLADGVVQVGANPALLGQLAATTAEPGDILGRSCLDWSERRAHLSGAIGKAMLQHWLSMGWVSRNPTGRGLVVSTAGLLVLQGLRPAIALTATKALAL